VTLHGSIASDAAKQRAEQLARATTGVREVRNLLAVVPEERRETAKIEDKELQKQITTVLERDAALAQSDIDVKSVNRGVVVLSGNAKSVSDHLRALEDARAVKGVTRVASEIRSPDALADSEIWRDDTGTADTKSSARDAWTTASVKLRLFGNRDIPGLRINVDTRGGIVTLFGIVPRDEVAKLAENEAKKVSGVQRVQNDLQVVAEEQQDAVADQDSAVSKRLDERIDADPRLSKADVDFEVKNGVVRVTGTAPTPDERLQILTLARSTEGVRSVLDAMNADEATTRDRKQVGSRP
jgi:hyperosmotically inducible periplasmic protein